MWDLAISPAGDLIFGPNRDLAGISGTDLLEQRMRVRMQIHRGSWVYDTNQTLGSNLWRVIGMAASDAHTAVQALVREALRPMSDEIEITEIVHLHEAADGSLSDSHDVGTRGIVIIVHYRVISSDEGGVVTSEERQLQITLPAVGGAT